MNFTEVQLQNQIDELKRQVQQLQNEVTRLKGPSGMANGYGPTFPEWNRQMPPMTLK